MVNTMHNEMNCPFSKSIYDMRYIAEKRTNYELRKQLFYLWTFVAEQGVWEDALDFLDEHDGMSVPFDLFPEDSYF